MLGTQNPRLETLRGTLKLLETGHSGEGWCLEFFLGRVQDWGQGTDRLHRMHRQILKLKGFTRILEVSLELKGDSATQGLNNVDDSKYLQSCQ